MHSTVWLAAEVAEKSEGWGKVSGLLIAAGLFYAWTRIHDRWRQAGASSTEPAASAPGGVKPQVRASSDPTFDPTPEEAREEAGERPTELAKWVRDRAGRAGYRATVRAGMARFKVSEATVKRALRRGKGGDAS